jgi:hypothetical protein
MRITTAVIKADIENYLSKSGVKLLTNAIMTDFVKENCVICKPFCNSSPNLVVFLINSNGVLINCHYLQPCGPLINKKDQMWLQVWKRFITPDLDCFTVYIIILHSTGCTSVSVLLLVSKNLKIFSIRQG